VPDYDPKLARTLQGADLLHPLALWNQFDALAHVPLMVIRGANSDILASTTLDAMLARRGELDVAVVPDPGSRAIAYRAQADTADCGLWRIVRRPSATLRGPFSDAQRAASHGSFPALELVRALSAAIQNNSGPPQGLPAMSQAR
jgi:hypothetical protein